MNIADRDYEAACVTAAKVYDRFEGEHKLKQQDEIIAQAEATLARLQEQRREIVNQYNLNKCEHDWTVRSCQCDKCGAIE